MNRPFWMCLILATALSACSERATLATSSDARQEAAASQAAATTELAPPPPLEQTVAVDDASRQAYEAMEEGYISDTAAQWAVQATAGSSLGDASSAHALSDPDRSPMNATGSVNGNAWRNLHEDQGTDWLTATFAQPVHASEIRVAMLGEAAVKSITRVEVQDEAGHSYTIWAGESDVSPEWRGNRTWFTRQFEPTPYKVTSVKLVFANAVAPGTKQVDAVQLVGRP